jgi:hypothetical protein
MTGVALLGLCLISMGWLFFLGGVALNELARRKKHRGLGFLPALVGSVTVFFSIPAVARYGIEVPWPWLWILLPLTLLLRHR